MYKSGHNIWYIWFDTFFVSAVDPLRRRDFFLDFGVFSPRTWELEIISQRPEPLRCFLFAVSFSLTAVRYWQLWVALCPLWDILRPLWVVLWPLWDTLWPLWDALMFPAFFHLWWHHCPNIDITLPSTMYSINIWYHIYSVNMYK